MNNVTGIQSIILVIFMMLSIICPGCKPGVKDENKMILSAKPTSGQGDHLQGKGIIPHKAKFSREWEE